MIELLYFLFLGLFFGGLPIFSKKRLDSPLSPTGEAWSREVSAFSELSGGVAGAGPSSRLGERKGLHRGSKLLLEELPGSLYFAEAGFDVLSADLRQEELEDIAG